MDLDSPNLYRLLRRLNKKATVVDSYEISFGIRTIKFDPEKGFFLTENR